MNGFMKHRHMDMVVVNTTEIASKKGYSAG